MKSHPWRTRAGLLAIVNAAAGLIAALGYDASTLIPIASAAVAALVDAGIVRNGEAKTTPV